MQEQKQFDAIIVGSGPGGASVAETLTKAGQSVAILEWGDNEPMKGNFAQMAKDSLLPGKSLYVTNNFVGIVRGISTGGSTQFYCATAFEPPVNMFKAWGVDLTREVAEIKAELPVAPLDDRLMSQTGRLFRESAEALGYDYQKNNKFIYQGSCRSECDKCLFGCPYGAKWTARNYVEDATNKGAKLITGAKVSRVLVENKRAVGVEYKQAGKVLKIYGNKIILSAGGIGSPMILRHSGVGKVGYNFFFDPLIFIWGQTDKITSGKGIPMGGRVFLEDEGILLTDHNMPRTLKTIFDIQGLTPHKALSFSNMMPIQAKIRDGLSGRMSERGWVWKKLSDNDLQKVNSGFEHAKRILEHAGAKKIYKSAILAAHPGGTVKIGECVDSNLQTEYGNLYVCDASVIPEEMGLPPTFTILALGKRLGKHLLETTQ